MTDSLFIRGGCRSFDLIDDQEDSIYYFNASVCGGNVVMRQGRTAGGTLTERLCP